jgi:hypothetical protein
VVSPGVRVCEVRLQVRERQSLSGASYSAMDRLTETKRMELNTSIVYCSIAAMVRRVLLIWRSPC